MQNSHHKQFGFFTIVSIALTAVLLTGVAIFATEHDRPKDEPTENHTVSNQEERQKEAADKTPAIFVPTEKVSADQAVAFPTDI